MIRYFKALTNFFILMLFTTTTLGEPQVVVGLVDIYPFGYQGKKGVHADWWREIARRSGIKIKFHSSPLIRVRQELNQNKVSLAIYGQAQEGQNQSNVINIIKHQKLSFSVISLETLPSKGSTIDNLMFGTIRGVSGFEQLHDKWQFIPVYLKSYDIGAKMLHKGRINAFYGLDELFAPAWGKLNNHSQIKLNKYTIATITNMVRASTEFSSSNPHKIKLIQKFAKELYKEGFIAAAMTTHLSTNPHRSASLPTILAKVSNIPSF